MGKKKQEQRVTLYYTSIQYAICHGIVERFLSIKVNDKNIVTNPETTGMVTSINAPELFGGALKEGGLGGRIAWQNGSDDQLLDTYVASKKGEIPSNLPGYRGIATAFFTEPAGDPSQRGFYWSANQPIIPPVHFEVTRIDRSWRPDIAAIFRSDNAPASVTYDLSESFPTYEIGTPGFPGGGQFHPAILTIGPFDENRNIVAGPSGANADDRFFFNGVSYGTLNFVTYPAGTVFFSLPAGSTVAVRVRDIALNECGATGSLVAVATGFETYDMNPAHIIRECLTNSVWGLGLPDIALDMDMFEAAAETLYDERFGLSMIWSQQAEIQEFVGEILTHIQATFYTNPMNGKLSLKLIRDDYDPNTLDVLTPSNSRVTSFKRRSPAEVTNEIAVTWTNPVSEKEEVVTLQSLGSIVANNGEIVSDNRNYYGVRRAELAAELCARDLAASTAPLSNAEVEADRSFSRMVPGDVVKLTDPENGAVEVIMRVMKVDYGQPGASRIQLSLTEDIFSYAKPRVQLPPTTLNPIGSKPPEAPSSVEQITINTFMYLNASSGLEDLVEPETQVGFIVTTENSDTFNVEIFQEETLSTGATSFESVAELSLTGKAILPDGLAAEVQTVMALPQPEAGMRPTVGGFALIGPEGIPEDLHEFALISDYDPLTGMWTLDRGMMDTVPRQWPDGTPVRYIEDIDRVIAPVEADTGVSEDYRIHTRTSLGLLSDSRAPVVSYTPTDRLYAPSRPANVLVAGQAFGIVDGTGLSSISVSWSNRNRLTEDSVLLKWNEASVTPEVGQTTTVRLIDQDTGLTINSYSGLTGPSYSFPASARGSANIIRVQVISVRDGYESIQGHEVILGFNDGLRVSEENNDLRGTEVGDTRQTED